MLRRFVLPALSLSSFCAAASMQPAMDNCMPTCCTPTCYDNDFFIEADFIAWYAKQEGNAFAVTGAAITVPGTVDPNTGLTPPAISESGKTYAPTPHVKPGFKVGVGLDLNHGNWELFSEYTYLYSDAKRSVSSDDLNTGDPADLRLYPE